VQADAVKAGAARLMLLPRDSVVVLLCYGTYEKRKERKKSELIIYNTQKESEKRYSIILYAKSGCMPVLPRLSPEAMRPPLRRMSNCAANIFITKFYDTPPQSNDK
jgi:hypothetical protein